MTRRRALIASAIASVAIFVVLAILDLRMTDAGGPGIVGFELAGTKARAAEILADWGSKGSDAAKASLWIDYAYILAYGTFLVLAAWATRDLALERGWTRMAAFGLSPGGPGAPGSLSGRGRFRSVKVAASAAITVVFAATSPGEMVATITKIP